MLKRLKVERLRGFLAYRVDFSKFNLLVGRNNVGKSTLVDSLRMISLESNPYLRRELVDLPEEIFGQTSAGFLVPSARIPFDLRSVHHEYAAAITRIEAEFDGGIDVRFAFSSEDSPRCYMGVADDGALLDSPGQIRQALHDVSLAVLPPVAELEPEEDVLTEKYVREWFGSKRSPRLFRNVWYHLAEGFDDFREMLRTTWPGADIEPAELLDGKLQMFFSEDRTTREVAWAGQGMQVWLQLLTYLAKMRDYGTLVLDEPEIFLHSDVQRKLIGLLQSRAAQVVVATHSVDIVNETPPEAILVVDRKLRVSQPLSTIKQVQQVVEGLGSTQNIQLVALLRTRLAVFVEGDDGRLLRKIATRLESAEGFSGRDIAFISLGGEANWRLLLHLDWYSRNTLGETLHSFLLLDRDYRPDNQVSETQKALKRAGVDSHIWKRKELENYLLVPSAILRAVHTSAASRSGRPVSLTEEEIVSFLRSAADSYREKVHSQLLSQAIERRPSKRVDPSTVISHFEREFEHNWKIDSYRLERAPGKDLVSDLCKWVKENYSVSLSTDALVGALESAEVDPEVRQVIRRIHDLGSISIRAAYEAPRPRS